MGLLAGAGAGGAIGGIVGSLVGMGIPSTKPSATKGASGPVAFYCPSVHCDDSEWVKRAKKILEESGAQEVSSTGEAAADYATSDRPGSRI